MAAMDTINREFWRSAGYFDAAGAVVAEQVQKAGVRLARLLNEALN